MTNKISHIAIILAILATFYTAKTQAADAPAAFRSTVFPLPRFVSLSSAEVFVRSGPGQRYPVKWVYHRQGLPVEVILEYEGWRKIRDADDETGWVHQSLISGKRTALIKGKEQIPLRQKPRENAAKMAILEPGVVAEVKKCAQDWCNIVAAGYKGWLPRAALWGVYEGEEIE